MLSGIFKFDIIYWIKEWISKSGGVLVWGVSVLGAFWHVTLNRESMVRSSKIEKKSIVEGGKWQCIDFNTRVTEIEIHYKDTAVNEKCFYQS